VKYTPSGPKPKDNPINYAIFEIPGCQETLGLGLEVRGKFQMLNDNELVGCISFIGFIGYIRKAKCQNPNIKLLMSYEKGN
jgi:hypothetical protein